MRRLAIVALVLAACEKAEPPPQPRPPPPPPQAALDIVIVLDMSKSMEETDLQMDRLDAAKFALQKFVAAHTRDRFGLVIFGQRAMLVRPLGADRTSFDAIIGHLQIGDVPELGTALGDGLALGVEQVGTAAHKAIVVLGDGENNWVNRYDPVQAAALAKQAHVPVYTVLVGKADADVFGMSTDPKELTAIAATTGGTFARAQTREELVQDLAAIGAALDKSR